MLQEALSRIRDAEEQAAVTRSRAIAEAKSIREAARKELQEMELSSREEIAADRENLFASARERGQATAEKIKSKMIAEIAQLNRIAERNMNDAVLKIRKRLIS